MYNIVIISGSVRTGRKSHRVALYLKKYIADNKLGNVEILDLYEYQFPLFSERLQYLQNQPDNVLQFAEKIKEADGVIVVTPEYNGGYPAAVKNAVDLLYAEWKRKPVGISTVSAGSFGGSQVGTSLSFTFLKIGAWVAPAVYRVPTVQNAYDENGVPAEKEITDKRVKTFLDEFFWCVEARRRMETN
ncbi:NAD(P)H-dependent oxidoreductase [Flaviaesturariibacter flavus]|uniref:NAD(P)H-dependent oxidoreductase n=1 Tax=Flaviaesturariibacter flavus TaxID=2502780 RepID=A0A4R1B3M7_9BACT|nr:NADPH-dependent FMN reductase [Flaviaesturariibacter flavus]TCJ12664.1 NAD(P)H-dependent oxidoreductase [Flaviaesturariibacter flavus]